MNEIDVKKQKNLFIVAVVTLIALIAGATYAYFSVGTSNLFGTSTINAAADNIGTVIMEGTNANLTMNLTAVDMMKDNNDITYYATPEGKTTDANKKETVIARAYVSPETDTNMYHCTYNLNISHTGTKDMYYTFLGVENAVAETDLYSYRVNEYDTLEACNNFIDSVGASAESECQQFGNKYSAIDKDEFAGLFTSQNECETEIANWGNAEETFTCYKRINAGDTYLKRQATPYNRSNAEIILTVNGNDYDWNSGMPSRIHGEFNVIAPQEIELTAGLRLINRSDKDQTGLAGSDISINITSDSLKCEPVNVPTAPTITASDNVASGEEHSDNYTLTFSGSTLANGNVTYYYGTDANNLNNTGNSVSVTNKDDITYYVKACDSLNPALCSAIVSYNSKFEWAYYGWNGNTISDTFDGARGEYKVALRSKAGAKYSNITINDQVQACGIINGSIYCVDYFDSSRGDGTNADDNEVYCTIDAANEVFCRDSSNSKQCLVRGEGYAMCGDEETQE